MITSTIISLLTSLTLALGELRAPSATGEQLYEEGEQAYFVGDFDTAIIKFEAAYRVSKLAAVLYNIALSYMRRYEISNDPTDLRRAKAVLQNFSIELTRSPELGSAENVRELSAKIDATLAQHPAPSPARPVAPAEVRPEPEPEDVVVPKVQPKAPEWKALAVGGGVLVGLGTGAAAVGIAVAVRGSAFEATFEDHGCSLYTPTSECEDLITQGKRTNVVAVVAAIASPLLVAGGVIMLTLGLKRRSTNRRIAPVVSTGFIGVTFHGKF